MGKHKKTVVDLEVPYQANEIGLKEIIYFSVGLFLLIVVTFILMWFMQIVLEKDALTDKSSTNPLALSKTDALPPEPRLQSAPGFGVASKTGFKNFELGAPQAEYRELQKQWNELLANGDKDEKTGTIIALPIAEAKRRLLEQSAKGAENPTMKSSKMMMSDASAGRSASSRIR